MTKFCADWCPALWVISAGFRRTSLYSIYVLGLIDSIFCSQRAGKAADFFFYFIIVGCIMFFFFFFVL